MPLRIESNLHLTRTPLPDGELILSLSPALQFLSESRRRGEPVLYVAVSQSIVGDHWPVAWFRCWRVPILFEATPALESLLPDHQYTAFHMRDVELGTTFKGIFDQVDPVKH